ncbi:hypothetical protein MHK_007870 [Candidatus Magnetomorum sp. HK-1]|nr:hypothetical protein MHK_007870 [Candidatus Magnetomorum sp. HK-1]
MRLSASEMLEKRPKVEQVLQAILSRENYVIKRNPSEHAGGKWRFVCPQIFFISNYYI